MGGAVLVLSATGLLRWLNRVVPVPVTLQYKGNFFVHTGLGGLQCPLGLTLLL